MDPDAVELCPLDLPLTSYMVLLFAFSVTAIDTEMLSKFTFLAPGLQALSLLMESSPSVQEVLQEVFWGWGLWLRLVVWICCRWLTSHTLLSYGGVNFQKFKWLGEQPVKEMTHASIVNEYQSCWGKRSWEEGHLCGAKIPSKLNFWKFPWVENSTRGEKVTL